MQAISWTSAVFYFAFGIFIFYQQLHVKNFRGSSRTLLSALQASALLGMLTGLTYLVYYGWTVVWWAPLMLFTLGILVSWVGAIFERVASPLALSLGGFIGWPICAYLMFRYIPTVS